MPPERKVSDETARYIVEQWGTKTPAELALELGIGRATVYTARRRWLDANRPAETIEIHIHIHIGEEGGKSS